MFTPSVFFFNVNGGKWRKVQHMAVLIPVLYFSLQTQTCPETVLPLVINTANNSSENVAKLKSLATTPTGRNSVKVIQRMSATNLCFLVCCLRTKLKMYKRFCLVLCGCQTLFLTLRMCGNIFEPKRVELTGDWRTLHSEKLHQILFW